MKLIKATGLAVIAALFAMALVGSGAASATGLCKAEPEVSGISTQCKAGTAYASGQEYKVEAINAFLENEIENVTCPTSQATLKQTEANTGLGVPLLGEITALTFAGCFSSKGFNCTVQSLNKPYKASLSSGTGLLTITGGGSGEPSASVSCKLGLLSCVFGNTSFGLTVESGEPAAIKAESISLKMTKREGFLKCPASATWTAAYVATSPTSVWVAGM